MAVNDEAVRKQVGKGVQESPASQVFRLRQMLLELGLEPKTDDSNVRKSVGNAQPQPRPLHPGRGLSGSV